MTFKQVNPGHRIPDLALRGLSRLYAAPVTIGLQDLAPYLIFVLLLGALQTGPDCPLTQRPDIGQESEEENGPRACLLAHLPKV